MTNATKKDYIWTAAKNTIKLYLNKIQTELNLKPEETAYDVLEAEDQMVIFTIHSTLKSLLESEISKRCVKKSYKISFSEIDASSNTCQMKLEASGYESYLFAGMLNGVSSDIEQAVNEKIIHSKAAILLTIAEVLSAKKIKGKFTSGLRLHKEVFYISLTFKDRPWKPMEFQNCDSVALIAEIARELPGMIDKELAAEAEK